MRIIPLVTFIFWFAQSAAQEKLNFPLKNELDSIFELHHASNLTLANDVEKKADSIMKANHLTNSNELLIYLNKMQKGYDSSNVRRVKAIIQQYGYPGKSIVDVPTNEVAFYVLQRYLNQKTNEYPNYLPILEKAAAKQELPFRLYAEALDRSLMIQGKEQIYGTQMKAVDFPMGNTGLRGIKTIVWPIQDAANVNERRKAIGLTETIEEKAKQSNVIYQVYTLEDVKKLQGN